MARLKGLVVTTGTTENRTDGGATIESTTYTPLTLDTVHTGSCVFTQFKSNGNDMLEVGYWDWSSTVTGKKGAYMQNEHGTSKHTLILLDSGGLTFDDNTVYHAGNSNKYDVDWTANVLKAAKAVNVGSFYGSGSSGRATLSLISSGNYPNDLIFGSNDTYKWSLTSRASDENYSINLYSPTYSGYVMTWLHNGYVGIGTSSPSAKLHVVGNIYATAAFESSDERLKDFGDDIEVDFDKLAALRKKYFRWKDKPEKQELGVSAQEIREIYPEIVAEDKEGYLHVDYARLSVVALAAIDKQEDLIRRQQEEIDNLKVQMKVVMEKLGISNEN